MTMLPVVAELLKVSAATHDHTASTGRVSIVIPLRP